MMIPTNAKLAMMKPERLKTFLPMLSLSQLKEIYEIILICRFVDIHTVPATFENYIITMTRQTAPLVDAEIQQRAELEMNQPVKNVLS